MFFKEFKDLRHKADRRLGLPDLLNYAFAEDDYTIVTKGRGAAGRVRVLRFRPQLGQPGRIGRSSGAGQPRLRAVR
jgi:hypothetical protein